MAEEWMTYLAEGEEGPFLCLFNLGLAKRIGDAELPSLVTVMMAFKESGKGGMGDQKERTALARFEDAYSDKVTDSGGVHFATVRGFGVFSMLAYAPRKSATTLAKASKSSFPGYEVEAKTSIDKEWEQYQEFFPDDLALAAHYDRIVVKELESQGDRLDVPRPVEHLIRLPNSESVKKLEKKAIAAGYTIGKKFKNDDSEELPFAIELIKEYAIDLEVIGEIREELTELAESLKGDYDGWQTPTVDK